MVEHSVDGSGSGTVIYKMTGSGNDFVVVDGRADPVARWGPERVRAVCARGTGVGADGVVVLEPGSREGAVRFHYFNSDGSRAGMCGNASLCATRLAVWLELAPAGGLVLETDTGEVTARCLDGADERAEIGLAPPTLIAEPAIRLGPREEAIFLTTVGVPHLVVLVDDVSDFPVVERGRALRSDRAAGPDGANVSFLARGDRGWAMRTYERGVEAETLACGTGAVACAAVLVHRHGLRPPIDLISASGATLTVSANLTDDGRLGAARLSGEGRLVFRAILGF